MLPPNRSHQSVVERSAQRFPVGEAGERILPRKPVELDLRLAHLGKVRREATEAEEMAELVVHRPPGDRPPDLILGLGANDQVLKSNVRGEIEAERPFRSRASEIGRASC